MRSWWLLGAIWWFFGVFASPYEVAELDKQDSLRQVVAAQRQGTANSHETVDQHCHGEDSTDVFYQHLKLNEVMVTGLTGGIRIAKFPTPASVIRPQELRSTTSTNIIDAISHQPGVSQVTTGGSISKPIIRGLGYNRVVVMSEGVRQEGQQWGDEHGVEVDGNAVNSVEILKGPASLMYGSDAMAGVVIFHAQPTMAEGTLRADIRTEYQTNNGLFAYGLSAAGNEKGFVWDGSFSGKMAHAYQNSADGYVPGSQFRENAGRLMLGLNKRWGHSHLTWTAYHLTPGIIEGERDEETGMLTASYAPLTSYKKALPFQRVKHYKLVWDNMLPVGGDLETPAGYLKAIVGYQQNRRQEFEESEDDYELFFKLHTLTYDLRYLSNEWQGWKFSAGVNGMYQRSGNYGEEYLIPDYRLFDIGFYATTSKQLGERWTLSGGLRYDHRRMHGDELEEDGELRFQDFSRHFNGMTGSVGAVWNLNRRLNLRLNVARGFRTPNLSELASNGVHEGSLRYEIGNRQLRAEYSLQVDLGMDFNSEYVSAQVALFANNIDNYIFTHRVLDGDVHDGYLTYAYAQGDAVLKGFEAGIDLHPVHSLHFGNTFSFVDARLKGQDADTRYLPLTPAPRWTSEVKWELMHHSHSTINHRHTSDKNHHSARNTRITVNNIYVAAALETYLKQTHVYRADDTETETPAYALLNLSAGTDVKVGGRKIAEVYLSADNILNRAYQSHLSRLKYADVNSVTGRRGVYNMGRNVTFKVIVPILFQ